MKKILLLIILLLFNSNSKILAIRDDDKMADKIYWSVKDYYSAYFEFPRTVDSLIDFVWFRINHSSDFIYSSMDDYIKNRSNITPKNDDLLMFLIKNRSNIYIQIKGYKFELYFKKKKIELVRNICNELMNPLESGMLFRMENNTYDIAGKLTKIKYQDKLYEEINRLKRKYKGQVDSISFNNEVIPRYALLRYERDKGLSSVCPDDSLNFQSPFLIQLDSCLNDFVKDKEEIEKIVFLTKMVK